MKKSPTETPIPMTSEEKYRASQSPFENYLPGLRPNDTDAYLTRLLTAMRKSGLTESEAVFQITSKSLLKLDEAHLSALAQDVFKADIEAESLPEPSKTITSIATQNEFMTRRYIFRYNEVTGVTEYIKRGKYELDYRPVDERVLNSIALNALEEGIDLWDRDVRRYLNSDRVVSYNPFDAFFEQLPEWDKKPRIDKLFRRVPADNDTWYSLAHTWFLGMVALWMGVNRRRGNESILILIGPQGIGKSTFCRSLMPPALSAYFTENFALTDRRKALLMLTRYGLINFDEINRITERQQPTLKNMLQLPTVDEFRPYASTSRQERRYASFIGTSNNMDVIADLTGSRRYICANITGKIDLRKPINHEQLYAEAVYEINKGHRYWLDEEEEQALIERNIQFVRLPPVAERLDALFVPGTEDDADAKWLYATQIYNLMYPTIHKEVTKKQAYDLSTIMQCRGIPAKRSAGGMKYLVKRRENGEIV